MVATPSDIFPIRDSNAGLSKESTETEPLIPEDNKEAKDNVILESLTYPAALRLSAKCSASIGGSNILSTLNTFVSMVIIARIDAKDLSASALIDAVQSFVTGPLTFGIYPISTIMSQRAPGKIGSVLNAGLVTGALATVPTLILQLTAEEILNSTGQSAEYTKIVGNYFKAASFAALPYYLLKVENQVAFATLDEWSPIVAAMLNLIITNGLGYIFAKKLDWGAAGVGYAFALSEATTFLGYTLYLKVSDRFKEHNLFSLANQSWVELRENLKEIFNLGGPLVVEIAAELLGWTVSTAIIGREMGGAELAAHEIAMRFVTLVLVPSASVGQACSIIIGEYFSQGRFEDVTKLVNACMLIGTVTSCAILGVLSAMPKVVASVFMSSDTETAANYSAIISQLQTLFIINTVSQFFDSIRFVSAGALQGAYKDTTAAMITGIISLECFAVPLGYILGVNAGMRVSGIYTARAIGLFIASAYLFYRWNSKLKAEIEHSRTNLRISANPDITPPSTPEENVVNVDSESSPVAQDQDNNNRVTPTLVFSNVTRRTSAPALPVTATPHEDRTDNQENRRSRYSFCDRFRFW
jgi:MATE family multidrug resistance protein